MLIPFINSFLSYSLLFIIFVALAFAAVRIGTALRKRKNQKEGIQAAAEENRAAET